MKVIQPSLFLVMKAFPANQNIAKRLFRESDDFRTMCEDYQRCTEALKRWDETVSEEAPARRREYRELLTELEREILEHLNKSNDPGETS